MISLCFIFTYANLNTTSRHQAQWVNENVQRTLPRVFCGESPIIATWSTIGMQTLIKPYSPYRPPLVQGIV